MIGLVCLLAAAACSGVETPAAVSPGSTDDDLSRSNDPAPSEVSDILSFAEGGDPPDWCPANGQTESDEPVLTVHSSDQDERVAQVGWLTVVCFVDFPERDIPTFRYTVTDPDGSEETSETNFPAGSFRPPPGAPTGDYTVDVVGDGAHERTVVPVVRSTEPVTWVLPTEGFVNELVVGDRVSLGVVGFAPSSVADISLYDEDEGARDAETHVYRFIRGMQTPVNIDGEGVLTLTVTDDMDPGCYAFVPESEDGAAESRYNWHDNWFCVVA